MSTKLNICFIDLRKAHDLVGGELLWKVLPRAGIPEELIDVIHKFYYGILARDAMKNKQLSNWLLVSQGLRQECVMSPMLFGVFRVARPEIVVAQFVEDNDFIPEPDAHGVDDGSEGGDTTSIRAEAVWVMLYFDDAGVISEFADGKEHYHHRIGIYGVQAGGIREENGDPPSAHQGKNTNTNTPAAA